MDCDYSEEESKILNLVNASFMRIDEGKDEDPFKIIRDDHS